MRKKRTTRPRENERLRDWEIGGNGYDNDNENGNGKTRIDYLYLMWDRRFWFPFFYPSAIYRVVRYFPREETVISLGWGSSCGGLFSTGHRRTIYCEPRSCRTWASFYTPLQRSPAPSSGVPPLPLSNRDQCSRTFITRYNESPYLTISPVHPQSVLTSIAARATANNRMQGGESL